MLLYIVIALNIFLSAIAFFQEIKSFKKAILWGFIVFLWGVIGYLIYLVFANKLKFKIKQKIIINQKTFKNYINKTSWSKNWKLKTSNPFKTKDTSSFVNYLKNNFNISLWYGNSVNIITSGNEFLNDLISEILMAKKFINLEFYIFKNDQTGKKLCEVLINKARQGVIVNLIYDSFGSKAVGKKFWKNLNKQGINTYEFLPKDSLINFSLNYRMHRKIVVVDGRLAYIGGINIRDDHMGKSKRLSPWQDYMIKLKGSAVLNVMQIFFNDLCFCMKESLSKQEIEFYFVKPKTCGNNYVSIVSSGPENDVCEIENAYLHLIKHAKRQIIIMSPYFSISKIIEYEILKAIQRGVKVLIYLPLKPDKRLVYLASLLNVKNLFYSGANVYLYKGFLHGKVFIVDDIMSIGSCNFDNRSFKLNFEVTSIIYNKAIINRFIHDIKSDDYVILTYKKYKKLTKSKIVSKIVCKICNGYL